MTRLSAQRPLNRADAVVASDPASWLPRPCRVAGPDRWIVSLRLGPVRRPTIIELGPARIDQNETGRSVQWETSRESGDILPYEFLLPAFRGSLVGDATTLRIDGSYDPPAGPLGRVADLVLSRFAGRTVRRLLDDVAATQADDLMNRR
jgi:hypothetical protein